MAITQTQIDELKKLLLKPKPEELVAWFKDQSVRERSGLIKPLEKFREDVSDNWHRKMSEEIRIRDELVELGLTAKQAKDVFYKFEYHSPPFCLCDFAIQPTKELKQQNFVLMDAYDRGWGKIQDWNEAFIQVLVDRDLKNINEIVASLLADYERDGGGYISIDFILLATERGLIDSPKTNDYLVCLSDAFNSDRYSVAGLSRNQAALKRNPVFIEKDIYRLLQAETDLIWNPRKSVFKKFCLNLMNTREIDRSKVLESVVRSLFLDSKKNVLQGAIKFLEELKLSPSELHVFRGDLGGLLNSPQPFVTKFAYQSLQTLIEKKKIDDETFLKSIGNVFRCPTKGVCKNAISFIKKLCKANSNVVPYAIDAMMVALEHDEAEVQKLALAWLASVKDRLHPDHLSVIADSIEDLSPSNRAAAKKLCGTESAEDSSKPKTGSDLTVERTTAIIASSSTPPSFDVSNYEPVVPIENHEELIDEIARTMESTENGIEAERLLDGISRLGPVPESLSQHAAPVLKTAVEKRLSSRAGSNGISTADDATPRVRRVLCLALGMKELLNPPPTGIVDEEEARMYGYEWPLKPTPMTLPNYKPRSFKKSDGPGYVQRALHFAWRSRLFWQRLEAIENNLVAGNHLPLLAAPTHEHGWILPEVFVERSNQWNKAGCSPDDADLILGLMRLAPVDRSSALKKCRSNSNSALGKLIQIALDGDLSKIGPGELDEAFLNVAAHVRQKEIVPAEAKRLRVDSSFSNRKLPILKSWFVNPEKTSKNFRAWEFKELVLETRFPKWISSHPVLSELYRFEFKELSLHCRWRTNIEAWNDSLCRDAYWVEAMIRMLSRPEGGPSNMAPSSAFLDALFDPVYVWELSACGAAAVALIVKDTGASNVAVDALIEAIPRNQVDAEVMGDAITRVFKSPLAKCKRFAENYARVAEASAVHRNFVARALESPIRHWAERRTKKETIRFDRLAKATDCGPILDLYLESLIDSEWVPESNTSDALSQVKAKGTVAKKIKSILALLP